MATTDDEGPPRSVSEQGRRFPPPASISVETLPPTPLVVDDRRRVVKCSDDVAHCRRRREGTLPQCGDENLHHSPPHPLVFPIWLNLPSRTIKPGFDAPDVD